MATILVTGGRGFIGTNLTNELRLRGHNVWTSDIMQGEESQHLTGTWAPINKWMRYSRNTNSIMFIIWLPNMAAGMARTIMKISGEQMLSGQKTCSDYKSSTASG